MIFGKNNDRDIKAGINRFHLLYPCYWRDFMSKAETKALIREHCGEKLGPKTKVVQLGTEPRHVTKKVPARNASISAVVGPEIVEAAEKEEEIAAMKRKKFAVGAKNNLISRLGMNPGKAHDFIGKFGPALANYLVDWFEKIPEDIGYGEIMTIVWQAIDEKRFSLVSVRFSTPPIVESCEHTLRAIEFIAESFAPIEENRVLVEGGEAKAFAAA